MYRKMVTFKSMCVCEHVPADRVGDAKGGLRNKERKPWRSSSFCPALQMPYRGLSLAVCSHQPKWISIKVGTEEGEGSEGG